MQIKLICGADIFDQEMENSTTSDHIDQTRSNTARVTRKYRKSSVQRLRWTPELHHHFVQVVRSLGGRYKATPKRIMQMMGVRGLKISHIKSHLQMYRSMKESIKNYQQVSDFITLFPAIRQGTQGRWEITTKTEDQFYHEYKVDQKGSRTSTTTKSDEIPKTNIELQETNTSECSWQGQDPINLDLSISLVN